MSALSRDVKGVVAPVCDRLVCDRLTGDVCGGNELKGC